MISQTREQYSSHLSALYTMLALGYEFSFPCSCVGTRDTINYHLKKYFLPVNYSRIQLFEIFE
jgi:hypothetical protein